MKHFLYSWKWTSCSQYIELFLETKCIPLIIRWTYSINWILAPLRNHILSIIKFICTKPNAHFFEYTADEDQLTLRWYTIYKTLWMGNVWYSHIGLRASSVISKRVCMCIVCLDFQFTLQYTGKGSAKNRAILRRRHWPNINGNP